MTEPVIRCVLYLRVSLDATGEMLAIARQREDCMKIAADRGWQVVDEYVDNSIGAYSKTRVRPGYNRMVRDYAAGQFDALVCYDLDRLTRIPRQLEDWIDAAEDKGLLLVTANGEADLTTDGGRLFAGIKVQVARAESERKAARQRRAGRQRAEAGAMPLGVRLTGYTTGGEIVEDEAAVIRQVFTRFSEGDTLRGITAWLTAQEIPTRRGAPWNPASVRTTLVNPRYAGRAVYLGSVNGAAGSWEPLVEDWLFDVVNGMLAEPGRRSMIGTDRKHLGSGLYLCGICGHHVRAGGGGPSRLRYRCPEAGHVTRSAAPVDELITLAVHDALAEPGARALTEPESDQARDATADIRRLRGRLRQAELDYDSDLIDGTRYKAKRDKITAELDEAEAARAALTSGLAVASVMSAADPVAAYDAMPLGGKRTVINSLMTVRLARAPRGKHFDPASVIVEWR